jgi:putative transposase
MAAPVGAGARPSQVRHSILSRTRQYLATSVDCMLPHAPSMPRTARSLVAGGHYHLINRGNNRTVIFAEPVDFQQFLNMVEEAQCRVRLRLLAVCVMPNHFHLVAAQDGAKDISRWMQWLLTTHAYRHHLRRGTSGRVWQGRFKAFPIEQDGHLHTVIRYVERNALRAGLCSRAEDWPWGSLAWRAGHSRGPELTAPQCPLPIDWLSYVNAAQTTEELDALRACVNRQRPYGSDQWVDETTTALGLESSRRGPGRPARLPVAGAANAMD